MSRPLLEARGLKKHFPVKRGFLRGKVTGWVQAVDGVDLEVGEGETLGLVGESGCGKTTIGRLLLLLEEPTEGSLLFQGQETRTFQQQDLRRFRSAVQPVFQNPFSSLDPRMRVGRIIGEPLSASGSLNRREIDHRVATVLETVGLQASDAKKYADEFSGGQRQRIAISRALASDPSIIILDEAVSSQDISIRAQILNLLKDLQQRMGIAYVFIAHDLATVRFLSDRVSVMYLGKIVESAEADPLCTEPLHPYTQALFASCLPDNPDDQRGPVSLSGEVPSPLHPPSGCRFHTRCPRVMPVCSQTEPALKPVGPGRRVACFLYE